MKHRTHTIYTNAQTHAHKRTHTHVSIIEGIAHVGSKQFTAYPQTCVICDNNQSRQQKSRYIAVIFALCSLKYCQQLQRVWYETIVLGRDYPVVIIAYIAAPYIDNIVSYYSSRLYCAVFFIGGPLHLLPAWTAGRLFKPNQLQLHAFMHMCCRQAGILKVCI